MNWGKGVGVGWVVGAAGVTEGRRGFLPAQE